MKLSRTWMWALAGALALVGCSGSSGGSSSVPTSLTFSAAGGAGSAGPGGAAGSFTIWGSGSSIAVTQGGSLPALPTWQYTAPALGDNPLTVSSSQTLVVGDTLLGDDGVNAATGLWVKAGATLTLASEAGNEVSVIFTDGVLIEGTLAMQLLAGSLSSSSLYVQATDVAVRGTLTAVGGDAGAGEDGGIGGGVAMNVAHDFFLTGSILATGGKGDNGGGGGQIDVRVAGPTYADGVVPSTIAITGLSDNSGGEGVAGTGGGSPWNEIVGDPSSGGACNLFSSGTLRGNGGKGTAGGGQAEGVHVSSCTVGWAASTGILEAVGGAATVEGPGGRGGWAEIESNSDLLYVGGALRGSGGAGAGSGAGGDGDGIWVNAARDVDTATTRVGAYVAAQLDVRGGAGANGGVGGELDVQDQGGTSDAGLHLMGYALLDARGGAGTVAGGEGGQGELRVDARYDGGLSAYVLGSTNSEAGIDLSGGAASAGDGGIGGALQLGQATDGDLASADGVQTVMSGSIAARGGAGTGAGGGGGVIQATDPVALLCKGGIDVSGGAAGTGAGGTGGGLVASGPKAVTVSGSVAASGGASTSGAGGAGGGVVVLGDTASLGAVTADGGAGPGATGGTGGGVSLMSGTPPSALHGTISVRGGAGGTAGSVGSFTLDGTVVTLTDGRYTP